MTFSTSQRGFTVGVTDAICSGIWIETLVVEEPSHPCGTPKVSRACAPAAVVSGFTLTWAEATLDPATRSPVVRLSAPAARRILRMEVPFENEVGGIPVRGHGYVLRGARERDACDRGVRMSYVFSGSHGWGACPDPVAPEHGVEGRQGAGGGRRRGEDRNAGVARKATLGQPGAQAPQQGLAVAQDERHGERRDGVSAEHPNV